jgi:hypothetical protein
VGNEREVVAFTDFTAISSLVSLFTKDKNNREKDIIRVEKKMVFFMVKTGFRCEGRANFALVYQLEKLIRVA